MKQSVTPGKTPEKEKKVMDLDSLSKHNRRRSPKDFAPKKGDVVKWDGPTGNVEVREVLFVRDGAAWFSGVHWMPFNELRPAEAGDPMPPLHR